jgi:hypothetical protein
MTRTYEQWIEAADRHAGYVEGLLDGSIGRGDIAVANMTVEAAIEVERRNVAYCLQQAAEAR